MQKEGKMKRHGQLIGMKPENLAEYKRYHAKAWPEILRKITECNIRNYSIYHKDGLLFASFEYVEGIIMRTWRRWRRTPARRNGGRS
jgi:L-rhamnose mutarotase